jgi:hypothetical protein
MSHETYAISESNIRWLEIARWFGVVPVEVPKVKASETHAIKTIGATNRTLLFTW